MYVTRLQVGNEFSSVEALWSQFENVMAKDEPQEEAEGQAEEGHGERDQDEADQVKREGSE